MEDERLDSTIQKPELQPSRNNILRTIISLALYVGAYVLFFRQRLDWIILLVVVIFIHEMGHFIAMKRFGYSDVKMLFIPFLGAYVSGQPRRVNPVHRIITLLAGPLPGMILGMLLYFVYANTGDPIYLRASYLFILLNAFNLLPVSPLDGGQLLETMFLQTNSRVQSLFIIISCVLLFYFSIYTRNYFFLLIVWLLIMRFRLLAQTDRVRRQLQAEGIDYRRSFEELSDEEYARIRRVLLTNVRALRRIDPHATDENEDLVVSYMRNILLPVNERMLPIAAKILVCLIWLVFLMIPVVMLLQNRRWF